MNPGVPEHELLNWGLKRGDGAPTSSRTRRADDPWSDWLGDFNWILLRTRNCSPTTTNPNHQIGAGS